MNQGANSKKILSEIKTKPHSLGEKYALFHGDCLDILEEMPAESVDMIFADPPYNLSNDGFTVHAGEQVSVNKGEWDRSEGFDKDLAFHLKWIEAAKRVLKPDGTIWISGTYHSIYQTGYSLQKLDFHIMNDITWYKRNAPPNLSCRYFTASHENLIWAKKSKDAKHTFNYEDMKDGEWHKKDELKKEDTQMRSVWSILTPRKHEKKHGKHPTQKAINLLHRIVLASTNPDDIILDPFTGSSTTGVSAIKHDRKFIGIDAEEDYLDLSRKRFCDLM